jgi:hypothetical protein
MRTLMHTTSAKSAPEVHAACSEGDNFGGVLETRCLLELRMSLTNRPVEVQRMFGGENVGTYEF